MTNINQIPVKRRIWEMINPFVFMLVCLVISVFAVDLIFTALYDSTVSGTGISLEEHLSRSYIWCYLVFYAAVLVAKRKAIGYDKFKYGHESANWSIPKCIAAAAAGFAAAFVINWIIDFWGNSKLFEAYNESAALTYNGQLPIIIVLVTVILGPMAEELIFRYMIFGRMRFYLGRWQAVILSSLLFGLYHGNILQLIYCTLIGIVLSVLYDKSGKLWLPIAVHMAVNLTGIINYF